MQAVKNAEQKERISLAIKSVYLAGETLKIGARVATAKCLWNARYWNRKVTRNLWLFHREWERVRQHNDRKDRGMQPMLYLEREGQIHQVETKKKSA